MNQKDIAEPLGVSASTICREIKRNRGQKAYRYKQAHKKAVSRRHQASCRSKKMTLSLVKRIEEKLTTKWSPEHISGVLRRHHIMIRYESIYRHVCLGRQKSRRVPLYSPKTERKEIQLQRGQNGG
jgi:IS30 family transposase